MKLIQNVGFVGLGLIGGSLAKGFLELGYKVSAYDKNDKSVQLAKEYGKFDVVTDELATFFAQGEYDLLYICLPVFSALEFLEYLGERNYKGVITDACSTKFSLCSKAKELRLRYIGGHPIAGGERFGFEHSDSKIFKNAYHILTHHAFGGNSDIAQNSSCGVEVSGSFNDNDSREPMQTSNTHTSSQRLDDSREPIQTSNTHTSNQRLDDSREPMQSEVLHTSNQRLNDSREPMQSEVLHTSSQRLDDSRELMQSEVLHTSNQRLDVCSFDELRWLGELRSMHERLGMQVELFSPKRHDLVFGYISHLSHICAYSLVSVVKDGCGDDIKFVGAGFKDTTRIASSNIDMWSDIFVDNDEVVLESIDKYIAELTQFRKLIAEKKHNEIRSKLDTISTIRRSLN